MTFGLFAVGKYLKVILANEINKHDEGILERIQEGNTDEEADHDLLFQARDLQVSRT